MKKEIQIALRALEVYRGDDFCRAEHAFRGLSDKEMDKEYGQSGKTRKQILDGYREKNAEIQRSIDFLKGLS